MTCPDCGAEIEIGSWPFCKDGHERGGTAARSDDIPGGIVVDNLKPGHRFYSHTEIRREMKAQHVENMVRHVPLPGTDKSPHTTSWDIPSAYALESARVLTARPAARVDRKWHRETERPDPQVLAAVQRAYEELETR